MKAWHWVQQYLVSAECERTTHAGKTIRNLWFIKTLNCYLVVPDLILHSRTMEMTIAQICKDKFIVNYSVHSVLRDCIQNNLNNINNNCYCCCYCNNNFPLFLLLLLVFLYTMFTQFFVEKKMEQVYIYPLHTDRSALT